MKIKTSLILIFLIGLAMVVCAIICVFKIPISYVHGVLLVTGTSLIILSATLPKLSTFKTFNNEFKFDQFTETVANTVVAKIEPAIKSIKEDGTEYIDHRKAFSDAFDIIKDIVKNEKNAEIDMRMIGVALCYTIPFFEEQLVQFIIKHPHVKFNLRICVVDPEYLSKFSLDTKEFDWAEFSKALPDRLAAIETKINASGRKNFRLDHFTFRGFPQRHGLMINTQTLFLGVVDWDWNSQPDKPRLTVGSNYYRYYDLSTAAGKSHIGQFRHWFTFYQKYFSIKSESAA